MDLKTIEKLIDLANKIAELNCEVKYLKDENKRLRELNDQMISTLEKLATQNINKSNYGGGTLG